ncbi:hypothetical protein OUQ_0404 [Helicobacter pylori R055a]|nr:hypothetical protein OUQ_0404 [Helicobacter pylori R055a]
MIIFKNFSLMIAKIGFLITLILSLESDYKRLSKISLFA